MPFKVVQTLEGRKYKLFTIPSGWESDNILRYPNKCISNYENGEKLVSEMLKHSDTEDDIDNYTQRRRPHNKSMGNVVLTNHNTDIASSADLPIELNYNLVYTENIQANSTNTSQVFSNDITPLVQDSLLINVKVRMRINEEENTINNKERNDSVEENTKENKEDDLIKNISKDIAKYNSNVTVGKETSV
ncbi:unnamed protein product [Parnassius mnemosyne]|uniref:Uncharacterized protein n=1 Tax=Parnassius mnemosyne TaxID=213953 RepID=A0AAV1M419_9NEOP